jgi:hypothetical protein
MKLTFFHTGKQQRAFTLVEAMMASTVLVMVITSMILLNLWGLAMAARQQIWMSASDDSTQAYAALMQDIHSANTFCIGSGSNAAGFATNTTTSQSDCLLIYPTPTNNIWICYYYNPTSNAACPYADALVRTNYNATNTGVSFRRLLTYAERRGTGGGGITNDQHLFTTEDLNGNPIVNNSTTPVIIDLYLGFIKSRNAQIVIAGPSNVADVFQVRTRVCARPQL